MLKCEAFSFENTTFLHRTNFNKTRIKRIIELSDSADEPTNEFNFIRYKVKKIIQSIELN